MPQREPIKVTLKDRGGNIVDKYIDPVVFRDTRYQTLMRNTGRDVQAKFLKFYKKPGGMQERPEAEMSAWLATFAFQQLSQWAQLVSEADHIPIEEASLRTFDVFGRVFAHLKEAMMPEQGDDGSEPYQPSPAVDAEAVSADGSAASDEAPTHSDTVSEDPPEADCREADNAEVDAEAVAAVEEGGDGAGDSGRGVVGDDTVTT